MKKLFQFLILFLISNITFGQNLAHDNYSVWDYLSNNLKGIKISICDTLTEKEKENSFLGKYLTTEISSNKKFFYLKFDSLEFSLDYSIRDTIFELNNYDIFIIHSDWLEIGLILQYLTDKTFNNFGVYIDNRILLKDKKSNEKYIIAIESLTTAITESL